MTTLILVGMAALVGLLAGAPAMDRDAHRQVTKAAGLMWLLLAVAAVIW